MKRLLNYILQLMQVMIYSLQMEQVQQVVVEVQVDGYLLQEGIEVITIHQVFTISNLDQIVIIGVIQTLALLL